MKNIFLVLFLSIFFTSLSSVEPTYSLRDHKGVPIDLKLQKFLNFKYGVFIEVGAHDGVIQSNTKLLEDNMGWTGILIEPSANLFKNLCVNRPYSMCYQCALGSFENSNTYVYGDFNGNLMASIDGQRGNQPAEYCVLMRSLQSILDEQDIAHVNFFSLDVEGYEINVLLGIDFSKTTFDYFLIEVNNNDLELITKFLDEKGYKLVENFSNYNLNDTPSWCGTHNDFLFRNKKLKRNRKLTVD